MAQHDPPVGLRVDVLEVRIYADTAKDEGAEGGDVGPRSHGKSG
jgi:hypothetical protein